MKSIHHENIKYFQSNLLKKYNFNHAFFTKRKTGNTPRSLQNELKLNSNVHYLNQIHSNKVIQANNLFNSKIKVGDCLITKERSQSLWIYTADCIPILIADIRTRNIAACHAGLKGIKKQIISKTLKRLEEIGSKKNNLIIAIGPSIKGDKYQVKKKDVEDLIIQLSGKSYMEKSLCLNVIKEEEMIPLFKKDSNPNKMLIDLKAAAILQLFK